MAAPERNGRLLVDTARLRQPDITPGYQDRGIFKRLKDGMRGFLSGLNPNQVEEETQAEQVRAGPAGIVFPNFLPFYDDQTGETPQARLAYRRMWASPEVKSALLGKVLAVADLDLTIVPVNEDDEFDQEVAKFVDWVLHECLEGGFLGFIWSVIVHGAVDGYSIVEKIYGEPEQQGKYKGKRGLTGLKPKDTINDLVMLTDEFKNVVSLQGLRFNAGKYFDPRRFVIYSHMPLYGQPTGMSDFRAAYGDYWILDTAKKLRASGIERRTLPLLLGTYTNATQKPSLDAAMAKIKSSTTWLSAPESCKVEAVNIAGQSDDIYANLERDKTHKIFLSIQGAILQALEGQTTDGRGNSKVQQSTADRFVWYLARAAESVLNNRANGLIKDIVDLNYAVEEYPRATITGIDPTEQKAELEILISAKNAGLDLSKRQLRKVSGAAEPAENNPDDLIPGGMQQMGLGGDGKEKKDDVFGKDFKAFAEDRMTALAGPDGNKVEKLLNRAISSGSAALYDAARPAVRRMLRSHGDGSSFFNDAERQQVADALAATTATAELLGRYRIRERQRKAEANKGATPFAEEAGAFECFDESTGIQVMPPLEALRYFLGLQPELGIDPRRFGPAHERQAFTLAAATEKELVSKVKDVIAKRLETGQRIRSTTSEIEALLTEAGVTPRNPQYAENVVRTNLMDSYNTGTMREMQQPDVQATFPVWRWAGIRDGRQRPSHEAHFDHYYPSSVSLAEIRDQHGFDGFNERCSPVPVSKYDWARLQREGKNVSTFAESKAGEVDEKIWAECLKLDLTQPGNFPWKIGEVDGNQVLVVNGDELMIRPDQHEDMAHPHMDFVYSGNDLEAVWIRREFGHRVILIDKDQPSHEWPFLMYHEAYERARMVEGLNYDDAHKLANAGERILRMRAS